MKHELLVGGIPVVNTPILGAIPKILDRITLDSLQKVIAEKWSGSLAERNISATKDAFMQVEVS